SNPGIASDASRAAQTGEVHLVTSELAGNLATLDLDVAALASVGGRLDTIDGRVTDLAGALELDSRRASGGIAAAMAMTGAGMPPGSTVAISCALATLRGEQGCSGAAVARVAARVWVNGGIADSTVTGSTGGRVGISFGW